MKPLRGTKLVAGIVTAAAIAAPTMATAGEGYTLLAPGRAAVVVGTHISCTATATSVTCTKAGGWTARMDQSGAVTVKRGVSSPKSVGKPLQLRVNGGFRNAGANNSNGYCHVYVAGGPTIDCSLTGEASGHRAGSHGFDMSDHSLAVNRFNAAGELQQVKAYRQP